MTDLRQGLTEPEHQLLDILQGVDPAQPDAAAAPALPLPGLIDILAERRRQIAEFGHDAEEDALLPIDHLARKAQGRVSDAIDRLRGLCAPQDLTIARRKLVIAAALILAQLDRIDAIEGKKK